MINAYAQDLGIQSLELALIGFVRWDLARSDGRPSHGEKHQDDVLAQLITQLDVFVQMRLQGKVWSGLSHIKLHSLPPS